ncbi:3-hydroxybenzoate 4-monooxygenase [Nocardioides sp. zg-579]|uniref:3-hydroxybenzoate 4-monooxygenase n=1 Tax=Nocardioides marmotae TaxID=2663857 RepID=A0A6I3J5H3_9ACTN|nr:FAD-dependent monooxygenase [Nocardioides marmotae]MCR6030877.1 3-hydroxybenzoate 4-monooxygenase [Gordonia jinghuaiqii]MTB94514.1 3-hydroxybenzoate 4-monooxygenase [Nocardioides marmotae]QKE01469.1 3-hydroxybenzoate 4-monooxygenase [Nocardioides marmotae]
MQFHHHGYVSGDPRRQPVAGVGIDRPVDLPEQMDVLVVGTGPAGMITAAQLSQFPGVSTRIIERREGRLEVGHADGLQARSVETFQAFGFAERLAAEAHHVTEFAFWQPDPADPRRIARAGRAPDDPKGLSEFPHILVNQARVLDYFAAFMADAPTRMSPDFGIAYVDHEVCPGREFPVRVTLARTTGERAGEQLEVETKYLVGADGAHSRVRTAMGRTFEGHSANHAWGVLDVLADTDYPDVRVLSTIQSSAGNMMVIPREGGFLFRLYVDLGEVSQDDAGAVRNTPAEAAIAQANAVLHPYSLDVKQVAWFSVYEVGHRLADRFDDDAAEPRVFILGDACHTHSAKGGQGMNVSLQDGFNLGWKLGHVLDGRAAASLLTTYDAERKAIAKNLIDFDKAWAAAIGSKADGSAEAAAVPEHFTSTIEFRTGFRTEYPPSMAVAEGTHQALATGFPIGQRFASPRVARVADTNPVHLGHHATADGRWRVYVFADAAAPGDPGSVVASTAQWLTTSPDSPLVGLPEGVVVHDRFDLKVVYQQHHHAVEWGQVPDLFKPRVGPYALVDRGCVHATLPDEDVYALRGIDRAGVIVVVRPDQYVAAVLPLRAPEELTGFFDGLGPRSGVLDVQHRQELAH